MSGDGWEKAEAAFYAEVEASALCELARRAVAQRLAAARAAEEELRRATARASRAVEELNDACALFEAASKLTAVGRR